MSKVLNVSAGSLQVLLAEFEKAAGDDSARGRAVATVFVGTLGCIDEQFAADVVDASFGKKIYAFCHGDTVFGDLGLWVDGELGVLQGLKRVNYDVSAAWPQGQLDCSRQLLCSKKCLLSH